MSDVSTHRTRGQSHVGSSASAPESRHTSSFTSLSNSSSVELILAFNRLWSELFFTKPTTDPATTNDFLVRIQHNCLTWSNGLCRLVKNHLKIAWQGFRNLTNCPSSSTIEQVKRPRRRIRAKSCSPLMGERNQFIRRATNPDARSESERPTTT